MQPLVVGVLRRERGLDLLVADDPAVLGVDEEHPAGLEPAALDHLGRVEVEDPRLGGEHDEPVVGHRIPARPQAVAVEDRADERAVGERDAGRAVPRLHERRVELVERPPGGVHLGVVLPRLGDHHQHGVRAATGRRGGAARAPRRSDAESEALGRADREEPLEVARDDVGGQLALAGAHPVAVALDGVDLAVVGDEPVRVGARPGREGVGREPRVDQGELGLEATRCDRSGKNGSSWAVVSIPL